MGSGRSGRSLVQAWQLSFTSVFSLTLASALVATGVAATVLVVHPTSIATCGEAILSADFYWDGAFAIAFAFVATGVAAPVHVVFPAFVGTELTVSTRVSAGLNPAVDSACFMASGAPIGVATRADIFTGVGMASVDAFLFWNLFYRSLGAIAALNYWKSVHVRNNAHREKEEAHA